MAADIEKIKDYIRAQRKLDGLSGPDIDKFLDACVEFGCADFWAHDWSFSDHTNTFSVTSAACTYDLAEKVAKEVGSVVRLKRLTSDDDGQDLDEENPHAFDRLFPNPSSVHNQRPDKYKVWIDAGAVHITLSAPPDGTYTLEVTWRPRWNPKYVSIIPSDLAGLLASFCEAYSLPMNYNQRKTALDACEYRTNEMMSSMDRLSRRKQDTFRNSDETGGGRSDMAKALDLD